jgi:hypothetical protein
MLDLPLKRGGRPRTHLSDLLDDELAGNADRVSAAIAMAAPRARDRAAAAR